MTQTALIMVDIQNDYFPSFEASKIPLPNMDAAAKKAAILLSSARKNHTKVIHVKHVMETDSAPFFHPNTAGAQIHDSLTPHTTETIIEKKRPNSFVGTSLEETLRATNIDHLIICGAMSQMCIDATVRAAVDLGFKVTLAHDACAAADLTHNGVNVPADMVHAAIMAPLAASYAEVKLTSEINWPA